MSGASNMYRYAERVRTDEDHRARYHYAPYEGSAFLEAYALQRSQMIRHKSTSHQTNTESMTVGEIDQLRRRFEVRGWVTEDRAIAREQEAVVRLWRMLAARSESSGDVRDLNCALKLGDRAAQLGADRVMNVREAVQAELASVDRMMRRTPRAAMRPTHMTDEKPVRASEHHFGMLLVNSSRSRAYVDVLLRRGLVPEVVVLVSRGAEDDVQAGGANTWFDNETPLRRTLEAHSISVERVESGDMNDPRVAAALSQMGVDFAVYSGFSGQIVQPTLLRAGVELLHVHGGRLPGQRGSTTGYYGVLEEGCCGASAIVLEAGLDRGAVVAQRAYAPPSDRTTMDHGFDPWMRADLLARVLARSAKTGLLPRLAQPRLGTMYYVMHPVLRHVAALAGSCEAMNERIATSDSVEAEYAA